METKVGEIGLAEAKERGKEGGKGKKMSIVATTRHSRTNDLTTSKALQWAIK